jgi:hypothetical protein
MKRGRSVSVVTVKKEFAFTRLSSLNLFHSIISFTSIRGPVHPKNANRVVGLAFLVLVSGWEDFVEGVFLRYMAGATFPGGTTPALRLGPCYNLHHAYEVFTGKPSFDREGAPTSFSNYRALVKRAAVFFRAGSPFSALSQQQCDRLNDASLIRNRVAHSSNKARKDFKQVALRLLGRPSAANLGHAFDVGSLLLSPPTAAFPGTREPTIFEAYAEMFLDLADLLAP